MQANLFNTVSAVSLKRGYSDWLPESLSNAAPKGIDFSARLRSLIGHTLGTIALTVALLAQPYAAMGTPATMPASYSGYANEVLPSTGAPTQSQYFAATDKMVSGDFLNMFQKYGLGRIGYPISAEVEEGGYRVQYFERVRMEFHLEVGKPGINVLLTRLGADMTAGMTFDTAAPFDSTSSKVYVPETRHELAEPFLTYWQANGGLELYGYPISNAMMQDGLVVQWFERARMEYHPELAGTGEQVQLGLLGKVAFEKAGGTVPAAAGQAGVASPQAPNGGTAGVELNDKESSLLKGINEQRAAAGLAPVQLSSALTELSRFRSNDMASRNYFSHETPEGVKFLQMLGDRGISYSYAGEILARNNYPADQTSGVAMDSYLGSPPHKAIIMDGRYSQVGIGYAVGADDMSYFTVIFVQP